MLKKGFVSQQAVDSATASLEVADANVLTSKTRLDTIDVELKTTVEAADARIRSVKDLLADLDAHAEPGMALHERLQHFLQEVTLDNEREEDKDENAGDAVTLITMHSCKGLEYPHVYVVGLEEGLLPHARSKVEGTLDEERRLFYVAITRAKREGSLGVF